MSVADWVFISSTPNNPGPPTGFNTELVYAPAGVIPAPPGGGAYGRILNISSAPGQIAGFYPSDPALSDIPYSPNPKAIRVNCLVYLPSTSSRNFAIAVKNVPRQSEQGLDGYSVGLSFGAIRLSLNANQTVLQSSPTLNTWLSWRLSVYPISPTADRVIAEFESSPGSGVWSSTWPQGSGDVATQSGVGTNYVPWGGTNRRNGAFANLQGFNQVVYIDLLKVTLANAPVPIP
jgi:hypothetical protein